MERERVVDCIRAAFAGVTLGGGISLWKAAHIDDWSSGEDTDLRGRLEREPEVDDNWESVPESELLRDSIAHLDDEGLRYYVRAFLLWLLDRYDETPSIGDGSMAAVGTMLTIAPPQGLRERAYARFDLWTPEQRAAIAAYVETLPRLVALTGSDQDDIRRAMRDYWGRFLPYPSERERVTAGIRSAFARVVLGTGVSLRQARSIDGTTFNLEEVDLEPWPGPDIRDDWSRVTEAELLQDNIAHLDDEGLRYYLPAFLLLLLDGQNELDPADMARIGTMTAIAPPKRFRELDYPRFDRWTPQQRAAVAAYVEALPRLVGLGQEEAALMERALRDYWGRFLPGG